MFKKGDKVYHLMLGYGVVASINTAFEKPITVDFPNGDTGDYFLDGKAHAHHVRPILYHTEPTITVPKRRVEHKGWIAVSNDKTFDARNTSPIYPAIGRLDEYTDGRFALQEITYYTEE